jgi:hypothetical protein
MGAGAFEGCASLESAALPRALVEIGEAAFADCGLTAIELPEKIQTLAERTFMGCARLTAVSLPDGLNALNASAFEGCVSLPSIALPDTLPAISARALRGDGLRGTNSVL